MSKIFTSVKQHLKNSQHQPSNRNHKGKWFFTTGMMTLFLLASFFCTRANANTVSGLTFENDISSGLAPQIRIAGKVTDANTGDPLAGVTIRVKGTTTGTVTDGSGNFNIDADDEAVLEVSFVGYSSKEVPVAGETMVNISLETSATGLDQLVVVGYGTQRKSDITGAVDNISSEEISKIPMTNLNQGLQGMSPNLNVDLGNGKPFNSPSINIRGETSIGQGGNALVLIDGVEGDLSMLNPNDVASISVLKGPAAAAEYGARAAFGVLQVTTKQATKKGFTINLNSRWDIKSPAVKPEYVSDGYTYVKNFHDAWLNARGTEPKNINKTQVFSPEYLEEFKRHHDDPSLPEVEVDDNGNYVYYASTDWYKELYKDNFLNQVYDLSASAGTDRASYRISGRFENQDGLFRYNSDKYKMYNMRANGNVQLFSWLKLSNDLNFSKRSYFNPLNVGEGGGIWRNIEDEGHPSAPMLNPDGTISFSGAYTVGDFYYGKNGKKFGDQIIGDKVELNADFFDSKLTITGNFSFTNTRRDISEKRVPVPYSVVEGRTVLLGTNQNNLALTNDNTNYYTVNLFGEYVNTFGGKHNVDFLAGTNYETQDFLETYTQRNGLAFPDASNINLALGDGITINGSYNAWKIFGFFYQMNYNYEHRYLITLSGRADGNSRFPSDQRYGFFPSGSVGWILSNEPFWNVSNKIISNLKVRGAYGSLGNGNVAPYTYVETLPISKISQIINGVQPQAISQPAVIPSGLTWETVTTLDFGLDFSLFSEKLSFTGDYYERKTKNMFTTALTPPRVFGAATPKGNFADLTTKGWELSLSWKDKFDNVGGKDFSYSISGHISDNKAKITKYNNPDFNLEDFYEGQEIGEIWGYVTEGLFQSQDEVANHPNQSNFLDPGTPDGSYGPGYLKFKDLNGDNEINNGTNLVTDPGDRKIIGDSAARYTYGFSVNLDWNGFFLSVMFQGVGKRDWYPSSESDIFWGQYNRPYNLIPSWQMQDGMIWSEENPNGYLPKYTGYEALDPRDLSVPQTRYLQSVAYLRLKNLQIGYNLPENLIKKINLKSASIYLNGSNFWMTSPIKSKNIDPETGPSQSEADVSGGTSGDGLNYPILKSYSLGLSLTF